LRRKNKRKKKGEIGGKKRKKEKGSFTQLEKGVLSNFFSRQFQI
jgi:hypothetical protein